MKGKNVITIHDVDWVAYEQSVKEQIENEKVWLMGGSPFAEQNIKSLKEELALIKSGDLEDVFEMYGTDVWKDYLKC